jgi:HEAT repeat protein
LVDQKEIDNQCLSNDPKQVWDNLIKLINDEDSNVRSRAADTIDSAFSQVPDKQQAWNDLHNLTNDEDSDVRSIAADAIGFAFPQVPDKQQAWNDLVGVSSRKE